MAIRRGTEIEERWIFKEMEIKDIEAKRPQSVSGKKGRH